MGVQFMSKPQAVNNVTYSLESFEIDYLQETEDNGYELVHITEAGETKKPFTAKQYESEEEAMLDLVGEVIPESFVPHIEKMYGRKATWDAINNVIFIGNPNGYYDGRVNKYRNARDMGMEAVDHYELSLVYAVQQTIKCIRAMVSN